jgi:hypothetical protein
MIITNAVFQLTAHDAAYISKAVNASKLVLERIPCHEIVKFEVDHDACGVEPFKWGFQRGRASSLR